MLEEFPPLLPKEDESAASAAAGIAPRSRLCDETHKHVFFFLFFWLAVMLKFIRREAAPMTSCHPRTPPPSCLSLPVLPAASLRALCALTLLLAGPDLQAAGGGVRCLSAGQRSQPASQRAARCVIVCVGRGDGFKDQNKSLVCSPKKGRGGAMPRGQPPEPAGFSSGGPTPVCVTHMRAKLFPPVNYVHPFSCAFFRRCRDRRGVPQTLAERASSRCFLA